MSETPTDPTEVDGIDEEFVRRAVDLAESNALRVALYQATGDEELLRYGQVVEILRKGTMQKIAIAPEDLPALKEKAVRFLMKEAADHQQPGPPSDDELGRLLELLTGTKPTESFVRANRAMIGFDEAPYFRPGWGDGPRPAAADDFTVAIIGAGFSGLSAAAQLSLLGIPFVIYERRSEVGGTWSINQYPDVRVDTMSATYQLGFVGRYPWAEHFARGKDVREYLEHASRTSGVHEHIRFDHDVRSMTFDETTSMWNLEVTHDGRTERSSVRVVISATGLFATPRKLEFAGIDDFQGDVLHTTQWPRDYSLAGKAVALIGNGSTGVQLLGAVAAQARRVSVFVRTPQWVTPREYYGDPIPPELRWLLDTMPNYWNWERYLWSAGAMPVGLMVQDKEWQAKGGLINEANDKLRVALTEYIKDETGGDPELYERLIPDVPPWSRRMIVDNKWYRTLTHAHVDLVRDPIDHVEAHAVVTADGTRHEADVIISAAGFTVTKYMWPIEVRGRGGRTLEDYWEEGGFGPRAFRTMTVPEFPNLFIMYGPNAQGGSTFPANMELWSRYIGEMLCDVIDGGYREFEVKQDVMEEFNNVIDTRAAHLIWSLAGDRNYYLSHGRVQVMAHFTGEEHWHNMTVTDLAANYHLR